MPDLMANEFQQIHEAIEAVWQLIGKQRLVLFKDGVAVLPDGYQDTINKVKAARELMADLAGGDSR